MSDWIQTHTGARFYPLAPRAVDIDIRDIAHALSMLCRFGGHCRQFYSVAQHSVLVADMVPPVFKRWALLHDASEAYLMDLPGPIKRSISGYKDLEREVMRSVCERYSLPNPMPVCVREADIRMLETERLQLFDTPLRWQSTAHAEPYDMVIAPLPPEEAEKEFLSFFACV